MVPAHFFSLLPCTIIKYNIAYSCFINTTCLYILFIPFCCCTLYKFHCLSYARVAGIYQKLAHPRGLSTMTQGDGGDLVADVLAAAHDEDLTVNPFFKAVSQRHPTILESLALKGHTLCVPCAASAPSAPTLDQIETHVLCKTDLEARHFALFCYHLLTFSCAQNEYLTLNHKMVRFEGGFVKTLSRFKVTQLVKILFEETYYDASDRPYTIVCIERPLEVRSLSF